MDLVLVTAVATAVALWAGLAAGHVSVTAWLCCVAVFLSFYVAGSLVASWRRIATGALFDLPLRLLAGYALVNTTLFVLAWFSPLGVTGNFGVVSVLIVAVLLSMRPVVVWGGAMSPGRWAVVLALVAATLWCQDSLRPMVAEDGVVIVKPWIDGFIHASQIRMLSVAHGAASIQDYRMAGVSARLYHYAGYMTPALVKHASALPSYAAFAGILVPMGILFTGLGAYALAASIFGAWPGLAACAALLLLPDGSQQGVHNTFLSYHWLAQISPGATFGLSIAALAWIFVLRGCLRGSFSQVVVGWSVGAALVVYKAQLFVAAACMLIAVPPLFFRRRLGTPWRLLWLTAMIAAFVGAVVAAGKVPSVPLIRLDGSSTEAFLKLAVSYADPSALTRLVARHVGPRRSWSLNLRNGGLYLLLATSGMILPALVALLLHLRKRMPALLVLFPLAIVVIFVVMALGMAFDTRHVGTSEELQHRPLLWMYFVLAAWTGALAAIALLRSRWLGRRAKPVLVSSIFLLLAVPAVHGRGVQRISTMPNESAVRLPSALLQLTDFMRGHGQATDIFQASSLDPGHILAALADRQPYYARQLLWLRESEKAVIKARADQVAAFMQLGDVSAINAAARRMGLRWFVRCPENVMSWPAAMDAQVVRTAQGMKLYVFD